MKKFVDPVRGSADCRTERHGDQSERTGANSLARRGVVFTSTREWQSLPPDVEIPQPPRRRSSISLDLGSKMKRSFLFSILAARR